MKISLSAFDLQYKIAFRLPYKMEMSLQLKVREKPFVKVNIVERCIRK